SDVRERQWRQNNSGRSTVGNAGSVPRPASPARDKQDPAYVLSNSHRSHLPQPSHLPHLVTITLSAPAADIVLEGETHSCDFMRLHSSASFLPRRVSFMRPSRTSPSRDYRSRCGEAARTAA